MRPNGIKTTYAYDAEDQITEVRTTCFCGHLISLYAYEYNESSYVSKETAKECLFTSDKDYGHKGGEVSWCVHTDANPWQNQVWETATRTFTYDENDCLTECKEDKGSFKKITYLYRDECVPTSTRRSDR